MTLNIFDLKVCFLISLPLGRPFLRKNTNSLFFCLIKVARYLIDSLRGLVNEPYDEARSPKGRVVSESDVWSLSLLSIWDLKFIGLAISLEIPKLSVSISKPDFCCFSWFWSAIFFSALSVEGKFPFLLSVVWHDLNSWSLSFLLFLMLVHLAEARLF